MASFGGLGRFKVKRVLLARRASTRNEKHTKAQSLGLYCCLLVTTTSPLYLFMNASVLVFTE
jgi:hypothetical protein